MFGFKKRKLIKEKAKFKIKDYVYFRYRDEQVFGYIYNIKLDDNENIIYDVQIAGQCPQIIPNVDEKILKIKDF